MRKSSAPPVGVRSESSSRLRSARNSSRRPRAGSDGGGTTTPTARPHTSGMPSRSGECHRGRRRNRSVRGPSPANRPPSRRGPITARLPRPSPRCRRGRPRAVAWSHPDRERPDGLVTARTGANPVAGSSGQRGNSTVSIPSGGCNPIPAGRGRVFSDAQTAGPATDPRAGGEMVHRIDRASPRAIGSPSGRQRRPGRGGPLTGSGDLLDRQCMHAGRFLTSPMRP
jgi:hypothetical protein